MQKHASLVDLVKSFRMRTFLRCFLASGSARPAAALRDLCRRERPQHRHEQRNEPPPPRARPRSSPSQEDLWKRPPSPIAHCQPHPFLGSNLLNFEGNNTCKVVDCLSPDIGRSYRLHLLSPEYSYNINYSSQYQLAKQHIQYIR